MKCRPFVGVLPCLAFLAGCQSVPPLISPPPCATLSVDSPCGRVRGQCLVIEDRILTVAHLFARCGEVATPRELTVDGLGNAVAEFRAGQLGRVAEGRYSEFARDAPQDWAALRVDGNSGSEFMLRIGDGRVSPAETLYVLGFDPQEQHGRLIAVPLRVGVGYLSDPTHTPLPDRLLVGLVPPGRRFGSGFSGAFVGRYDATRRAWEYIGQVIYSGSGAFTEQLPSGGTRTHDSAAVCIVVRPPDDVLRWFTGDRTGESP